MSEKSPGSDMKFVFWDDPGDSQEHVDRQCSCKDWQKEIMEKELMKIELTMTELMLSLI
jgi:hypothetical protein